MAGKQEQMSLAEIMIAIGVQCLCWSRDIHHIDPNDWYAAYAEMATDMLATAEVINQVLATYPNAMADMPIYLPEGFYTEVVENPMQKKENGKLKDDLSDFPL